MFGIDINFFNGTPHKDLGELIGVLVWIEHFV